MDTLRDLTAKDDTGTRHVVSRDTQIKAVKQWFRRGRGELNYGALGYEIDRAMGEVWQGSWNFATAADRVVQRLRAAQWIEKIPGGRGWRPTEAGLEAASRDFVDLEVSEASGQ